MKRVISAVVLLCSWLASAAQAEKLKGYVWDVQGSTLVVEGVSLRLSEATKLERQNQPGLRPEDLRIGWEVEVEGDPYGQNALVARKIKVKSKRNEEIKVEGFVEEIRPDSVYSDGKTLLWPKALDHNAVQLGMQLKGEGVVLDDGTVELKEYRLKPRERDQGEQKFRALAAEELSKLKQKLVFYDDRLFQEYVNRVGQNLVPDYLNREELAFNFSIVDDPDLNAFALPDGTVVVHSGLLAVLENEAQLAAVLGHEIAHVTHKHSYRGYRTAQKLQWVALGAAVAGAVVDASSDRPYWAGPSVGNILFQVGAALALTAAVNGHGRNLEDDADRIGLRYGVQAGYDPYQAPAVWRIFDKHVSDQNAAVNWLFSDHSTHRARVSNLTREINLNYRQKVQPGTLLVNADPYGRAVVRLRRHNAIRDYQRKEYKNSEKAFRELLEQNPRDAVSHLYLGNIYRDTGEAGSKKALAEYQEAQRLDPDLAEPYRELGFYYYGSGDTSEAIKAFETYLAKDPQAQDAVTIRQYIRELSR